MAGSSHAGVFRAAVLGKPIRHSRSPVLHNAGYKALGLDNWEYSAIECDDVQLPSVVENAGAEFVGFSVTMPGKFAALAFASSATKRAQLIGSANTLVRDGDGWLADNTDCDGVVGALDELIGADITPEEYALIIGAGGTARPALWALVHKGVRRVVIVNRSDRRAEFSSLVDALGIEVQWVDFSADLAALAEKAVVVVSTVPSAGIADYVDALARTRVLDVIYDPWPTVLVCTAQARGYQAVGGHVMLAHQAYGQFKLFTSHEAPREAMWQALCADLGIDAG
ncbi:MAG: shikimate dehydrogenase [Corynebacterium sp.]|uniref:shikimate dehydrogenase n=1 Tax=Corynebacterium sp. TaxID=1720 RepID=UPI0026DC26CE|nr:shikimate dehydrogenase [Corynebacterium sp.]MDO4760338.1 shikimate dehydrogenase [Corynebacterium sp.]